MLDFLFAMIRQERDEKLGRGEREETEWEKGRRDPRGSGKMSIKISNRTSPVFINSPILPLADARIADASTDHYV